MNTNQRTLDDYIEYFESLSPRSLRLIEKLAEPGMRFKDPFNDVQGTDAVIRVFEHMFENTQKPKFTVTDAAWGRDQNIVYLRWNFDYEMNGKPSRVEGMSEVLFSKNAKILSHIDHWDAGEQFYERIPVLGAAIRFLKSKLKVE